MKGQTSNNREFVGLLVIFSLGLIFSFRMVAEAWPSFRSLINGEDLYFDQIASSREQVHCAEVEVPKNATMGFYQDDSVSKDEKSMNLFLTRYVLAPRIVVESLKYEWTIAFMGESKQKDTLAPGIKLIKKCQPGISLFRREIQN